MSVKRVLQSVQVLFFAALTACSAQPGCSPIEGNAAAWRSVTRTRAIDTQVTAVISPYSSVTNLAFDYVYCAKYPIPSYVTSVEVGVTNIDLQHNQLPGAYTMKGLAIGTSDSAGDGWLTAPAQTWSNVSVPGDGSIVWNGPVTVTGPLLVAWQFTAGSNVAYEFGDGAAQIYGYVNALGTTNVTTLAGMTAVDGVTTFIGGNILLRYRTDRTKLITVSDSIHRGIQYQGVPSTEVTLVGSANWAVAVNGVASTTANLWSDSTYWPWSHYTFAKSQVFEAFGINDIQIGRTAVQIIADLILDVANARAAGAWSVGISTITPFSGFSGAQNVIRNTVNTTIRNGGISGANWFVDADNIIDPTHTNAVPVMCGGPIHLNATCLAMITAAIPVDFQF